VFRFVCLIGALGASALAQTAPSGSAEDLSGVRVALVLEGLQEREGQLVSADSRAVVLADETGRRRETALGSVLAIVRREARNDGPMRTIRLNRPPAPTARDTGVLVLVDGQRFPGRPGRVPEEAKDVLVWRHSALATLTVPIENIAGFSMPDTEPVDGALSEEPPAQDLVVLVNGDRLSGFFEWVGLGARVETDTGVVPVEPELIDHVVLANPRTEISGGRAWLVDGTVIAVTGVSFTESGRLTLALADGRTLPVRWESLRAVATGVAGLVALSSLEVVSQKAVGDRVFLPRVERLGDAATAPALGAFDLLLEGPMEVEWAMPDGSRRAAGRVSLAPGVSEWGDCEVIIEAGRGETWRTRLGAGKRVEAFNLAVAGGDGRLRVRVEPGVYGPIENTVVLEGVVVEVEK